MESEVLSDKYFLHLWISLSYLVITGCAPDACRYPQGYSIMFISAQSPVYQGCHWAVYDMSGKFWGYDADDSSSDVYDYESDDMPPGCQLDSKDALLERLCIPCPCTVP